MNNFCFCINLKSGVFFIAALAVFLNLICAYASVRYDTNLAFFFIFIFRFIICVLGFVGIILVNFHNPKCIPRLSNSSLILLSIIADIMQVYFYFAILSYYEELREKNNRSGSNNGNGEVSASTYGAVSDQV
ncbi:unnamed protein product [Rhizophagus irregularis]|nr:unnamed protein product [Rhizophagus irregularis]